MQKKLDPYKVWTVLIKVEDFDTEIKDYFNCTCWTSFELCTIFIIWKTSLLKEVDDVATQNPTSL